MIDVRYSCRLLFDVVDDFSLGSLSAIVKLYLLVPPHLLYYELTYLIWKRTILNISLFFSCGGRVVCNCQKHKHDRQTVTQEYTNATAPAINFECRSMQVQALMQVHHNNMNTPLGTTVQHLINYTRRICHMEHRQKAKF